MGVILSGQPYSPSSFSVCPQKPAQGIGAKSAPAFKIVWGEDASFDQLILFEGSKGLQGVLELVKGH